MLRSQVVLLRKLQHLPLQLASTLQVAAASTGTCSSCAGNWLSFLDRCDGRVPSFTMPSAANWSCIRHAHDHRDGLAGDSWDANQLSSQLSEDALRLVKDPVTMLMSARGVPLGVVMQLPQNVQEADSTPDSIPAGLGGIGSASGAGAGHGDGDNAEGDDADTESDLISKDRDLDRGVGSSLHAQQADAISALKQELKHMDDIFEVLAEVPWLDEAEPQQAEKKVMLQQVLVSTLEESGWHLRAGLESIWQGERDPERVAGGASPRERLALISVLYHVQQYESQFGTPAGLPKVR